MVHIKYNTNFNYSIASVYNMFKFCFGFSSTETDIGEMLKAAGDPTDEGISDISKNSHFIINPSKALREQVIIF